jgi:hypothetical protein
MPDRDRTLPPVPESKGLPQSRTRLSLVWFIPIVAALVGVWVAVTRIMGEGPIITIVFHTAEGLEAGKTNVHYNGVDIGKVTAIRLSEDHLRVIISAQMMPKTEVFLGEDTKFWVAAADLRGQRNRAGHADFGGVHRDGDRRLEGEAARLRGTRDAAGDNRGDAGAVFRAEDAGPRFAGYRNATLLPAGAGRSGGIVRARPGWEVVDGQGVCASAL